MFDLKLMMRRSDFGDVRLKSHAAYSTLVQKEDGLHLGDIRDPRELCARARVCVCVCHNVQ